MNIKDKAKKFAIEAHKGQVRKSEPEKPKIIHPINVAMILEEYDCDENVVVAGYLHDVVEDTKYTIEDIKKEFGDDIADLVMRASEPDKSLSWEERKKHTIEETKKLPLRNKLVICADKINNLEDLVIIFQKNGEKDFSSFKRGELDQKWYFEGIYESLIYGENKEIPIFERLKNAIEIVFYDKEDIYLRDTIFKDNQDYYNKLKKLHAQKEELMQLKKLCSLEKPFIIEFSGTPRTGKTTTINNLYDFFKKGGFSISLIEEFTTSKYYKEIVKKELENYDIGTRNLMIIEYVYNQLLEAISLKKDIIIIDRSLNDRQIWNYNAYKKGKILQEDYEEVRDKYSKISKELIDDLIITYADSLTSLKRDYNSSLALEERSFLNIENINEFNESLNELNKLFSSSVEELLLLDTSNINLNEVSTIVANEIMPVMRKKYIKSINSKYNA